MTVDEHFFGDDSPEGAEYRDEQGCLWRKENGEWVLVYIVQCSPDPNGSHGI